MQNTRPLFSVYGNCQAAAIATVLKSSAVFNDRYDYAPLRACFAIKKEQIENWINLSASKVDLLVVQHLKSGWRGDQIFDTNYLKKQTGSSCQMIVWHDLYYRGYSPEITYPRKFPRSHLNDYVSLIAELGFLRGIPAKDLVNLHNDQSAFHPQLVEAVHKIAEHDLRRREEISRCDIRISAFMAENWRAQRHFETFNHPLRTVLCVVARQIYAKIQLDAAPEECGTEPLGVAQSPPLAAFERLLHRQSGPSSFQIKASNVSAMEYYSAWYEEFERIGRNLIAQDLQSHLETDCISHLILQSTAQAMNVRI